MIENQELVGKKRRRRKKKRKHKIDLHNNSRKSSKEAQKPELNMKKIL